MLSALPLCPGSGLAVTDSSVKELKSTSHSAVTWLCISNLGFYAVNHCGYIRVKAVHNKERCYGVEMPLCSDVETDSTA